MVFTPVWMRRAALAAARTGLAIGFATDMGLRATTGFFAGLALVTFLAAALRAGCFLVAARGPGRGFGAGAVAAGATFSSLTATGAGLTASPTGSTSPLLL